MLLILFNLAELCNSETGFLKYTDLATHTIEAKTIVSPNEAPPTSWLTIMLDIRTGGGRMKLKTRETLSTSRTIYVTAIESQNRGRCMSHAGAGLINAASSCKRWRRVLRLVSLKASTTSLTVRFIMFIYQHLLDEIILVPDSNTSSPYSTMRLACSMTTGEVHRVIIRSSTLSNSSCISAQLSVLHSLNPVISSEHLYPHLPDSLMLGMPTGG